MNRALIANILSGAICFVPMPSLADTTSTLANVIAAEQMADIATTSMDLHEQRCVTYVDPALPIAQRSCSPMHIESDPLARPFVHSMPVSIAAAAALNIGLRFAGEKAPVTRYALGAAALLYPLIIMKNAHAVGASFSVKL